jgi:tetratricopeptide (TPR) repeat protein
MLSLAIQPHLPDAIDPDDCAELLSLKCGLDDSYGETYFLDHQGAMLVLTRSGSLGGFEMVTLPPDRPPTLRKDRWRTLLCVETDDGKVHELDISNEEGGQARVMLESIYRARGLWSELAGLMAESIEGLNGDRRLEALMELGNIYLEHLDAPDKANDCYAVVHDSYTHIDQAIGGMEKIVGRGYLADTIGPILELRYRRGDNPKRLAWLLAIRAPTLATPAERAAAYLEATELTIKLDQVEDALALVGKALVETPEDAEVLSLFDDLAVKSGSWATALAACQEALRDDVADPTRSALLSRIVSISIDRLHRWEPGEAAARELLTTEPQQEQWWIALDTAYTAQARWTNLVEVIEARAVLDNQPDRAKHLFRMGQLFEEELDDTDSACATYHRVLAISPFHEPSFRRLEDLHRERGELDQLHDLLSRWLRIQVEPDKRITAGTSLAQVCEELDDLPAAIAAWSQVLEDQADHSQALENLVRLHRKTENWQEAIGALLRQAGASPQNRLALLIEACTLCVDRLQDRARALEICLKAQATCPVGRSLLDKICELATDLDRDDALVAALRELADMDSVSMEDALAYRMDLADALERVGEQQESLRIWKNIAEALPDNARALASLYRLHTLHEEWAELAVVVARTAALTEDPVLKVRILGDLALLYEDRLDSVVDAAGCCEQILAIAPDNEDAVERLSAHLATLEDWPRLLELYRSREMHAARAALLEQRLGDPAGALTVLRSALVSDWKNLKLAGDVARLAQLTGSEHVVLAALTTQFGAMPDSDSREFLLTIDRVIDGFEGTAVDNQLRLALGDHYETLRADYSTAAKHYALVTGPLHKEGLRRLCDMLRKSQSWNKLSTQLEGLSKEAKATPGQRRAAFRELAEVYEKLDKPDQAKRALQQSKSSAPLLAMVLVIVSLGLGGGYWWFFAQAP